MRKPIIAGNWKMHLGVEEATAFVREIEPGLAAIAGVDRVVCPPAIALPAVAALLADSPVAVGAQNVHYAAEGAFTGELAPAMIAPYCQYVIIGHSERRAHFGESDALINRKVLAALAAGLIPIVCVGESLAQKEAGETQAFVSGQVTAALAGLTPEQVAGLVLAYEPIWAIGTGLSADPAPANEIISRAVRAPVAGAFGEDAAAAVRIQYGGSVKPANIAAFMAEPDIDGALVGGASLKPTFVELVANGRSVYPT